MNELHELMNQFGRLGGAIVGHGPTHPEVTNTKFIADAFAGNREFILEYPSSSNDTPYLDFLDYYGGARIRRRELRLDIFGPAAEFYDNESWDDIKFDWDSHRVMCCINSSQYGRIDYGYSATEMGIFKAEGNPGKPQIFWFCNNFLGWLELLVKDVNLILK